MTAVQLLCALARELEVSVDDLRGLDRSKSIRIRRSLAMLTIRENTELSFSEIARLFERHNHTTVLASCRSGELYRAAYPELAEKAARAARTERRTA